MKKILDKKKYLVAAFFIVATSCTSKDPSLYGKINQFNSGDKNSFTFSVSEEFLRVNSESKQDEDYALMSEAEALLLRNLLWKRGYCVNQDRELSFAITSRQEKIYDATFQHLIEQNYNARPAAPRMYFGVCR